MAMKNETKKSTPHESVMISSVVKSTLLRGNLVICPLSDKKHMTVATAQAIIMTRFTMKMRCRILS